MTFHHSYHRNLSLQNVEFCRTHQHFFPQYQQQLSLVLGPFPLTEVLLVSNVVKHDSASTPRIESLFPSNKLSQITAWTVAFTFVQASLSHPPKLESIVACLSPFT